MILGSAAAAADPDPALQRVGDAARRFAQEASALPSDAELRARCGADGLCAALLIAAAAGSGAALFEVRHPGTDSIRWVTTRPSVTATSEPSPGHRLIALERFGRKVVRELAAAMDAPAPLSITLDLRCNSGGDLGRMLDVAALFTGPVRAALALVRSDGRRSLDIEGAAVSPQPRELTLLVGPNTASSAEVLTLLLRRHADARVVGGRTAGKDWVARVIPVSHDWRLVLPSAGIEVPGLPFADGVEPDTRADAPADACASARSARRFP